MEAKDLYKTIDQPGEETLFKDKNSKFFGYTFPISNEEEVKEHLEELKKQHHSARHWCYAWRMGEEDPQYRANDDGEPSNSAGQPIYGQILSQDLTNILVVVVRYFGGVKLGVGGLINAYKTSAQLAIEASVIITKTINHTFLLTFEYKDMNNVMRVIKEHQLNIINQDLYLKCKIWISVRKSETHKINELFSAFYEVQVDQID